MKVVGSRLSIVPLSFHRQRYFDIYCDGNAVDTDTVSKSVKTIKYKA